MYIFTPFKFSDYDDFTLRMPDAECKHSTASCVTPATDAADVILTTDVIVSQQWRHGRVAGCGHRKMRPVQDPDQPERPVRLFQRVSLPSTSTSKLCNGVQRTQKLSSLCREPKGIRGSLWKAWLISENSFACFTHCQDLTCREDLGDIPRLAVSTRRRRDTGILRLPT